MGLGVVFRLDGWKQFVKDPPDELAVDSFDSARYAFELNPISDYDFEVSREQCVLHSQNGEKHWFDRRHKQARSNIAGFAKMELFSPSSLAMPVLGGVLPFENVQQTLGLSPGVRQTVKALLTVRWNCIVPRKPFLARWAPAGEAEAGSAGVQPAKE
jgi:hypothetical protein